jgi:hypothetical protein
LAYINDACFDPGTRFGFSNFCIGREDISRMRSALSDTTWGGFLALVAQLCEPPRV